MNHQPASKFSQMGLVQQKLGWKMPEYRVCKSISPCFVCWETIKEKTTVTITEQGENIKGKENH